MKRPMLSAGSANDDKGSRYFGGTPEGCFPSVMYVRFSSHFTSRSSGFRSRYFVKYSMAFAEAAVCV